MYWGNGSMQNDPRWIELIRHGDLGHIYQSSIFILLHISPEQHLTSLSHHLSFWGGITFTIFYFGDVLFLYWFISHPHTIFLSLITDYVGFITSFSTLWIGLIIFFVHPSLSQQNISFSLVFTGTGPHVAFFPCGYSIFIYLSISFSPLKETSPFISSYLRYMCLLYSLAIKTKCYLFLLFCIFLFHTSTTPSIPPMDMNTFVLIISSVFFADIRSSFTPRAYSNISSLIILGTFANMCVISDHHNILSSVFDQYISRGSASSIYILII